MVRITGGRDCHAGPLPGAHNVGWVHTVPTAGLPTHVEQLQQKWQEHEELAAVNIVLTCGLLGTSLIHTQL